MKTIIVYMTKHGCSRRAAELLESMLAGEVRVVDLKDEKDPPIGQYDSVIVGGSIHAGQVQKKVKKFCEKNVEQLLGKRLGLYLCCMEEGEKARAQFEEAFDPAIREHAAATGLFGGELDLSKMNFLERKVIQKVADITESVSKFDEGSIREFARLMDGAAPGAG